MDIWKNRMPMVEVALNANPTQTLLQSIRDYDEDNSLNVTREYCLSRIAVICDIEDEDQDKDFISNINRFKNDYQLV